LPVQLTQQVAAADRVVLTNYEALNVEFSGAEAQKILHAVSESKGLELPKGAVANCPPGQWLQFYRGTNLLAQVEGHDDHFHIGAVYYTDRSRVLQTAWKAVYEKQRR